MKLCEEKRVLMAGRFADTGADYIRELSRLGFEVSAGSSTDYILDYISVKIPDILVTEINLPGSRNLLDVLKKISSEHDTPVIIIAESVNEDLLADTGEIIPYAFLIKPVNERELISNITAAALRHEKKSELRGLMENEIRRREIFGNMSGNSRGIMGVIEEAAAILNRNINVLITGESGTGKELLARAIHKGSRRKGPFVAINCAAITGELSDSLLFGHRRGAFTGAVGDHAGFFEQAGMGTIFLDEIGDMKPDIQAKVLRVVEDKKIRRIGEKTEREIDVRIISATNRDMQDAVESSAFRNDLYYRLEEYHIHIPPLRDRLEDIPLLSQHFLESLSAFYELEPMQISESAMKILMNYSWPGNIRELKNVIQRSAIGSSGSIINVVEISGIKKQNEGREKVPVYNGKNNGSSVETLQEIERRAIIDALKRTDGNVAKAALLLNIGRATLYRKIGKLEIKS